MDFNSYYNSLNEINRARFDGFLLSLQLLTEPFVLEAQAVAESLIEPPHQDEAKR
ncbi:MAG: hypothetical protein IKW13_06995 [Thermoguttaceae bacterium]|nr:hypothetical protein [Thermoguttaceae bacterium]